MILCQLFGFFGFGINVVDMFRRAFVESGVVIRYCVLEIRVVLHLPEICHFPFTKRVRLPPQQRLIISKEDGGTANVIKGVNKERWLCYAELDLSKTQLPHE